MKKGRRALFYKGSKRCGYKRAQSLEEIERKAKWREYKA